MVITTTPFNIKYQKSNELSLFMIFILIHFFPSVFGIDLVWMLVIT